MSNSKQVSQQCRRVVLHVDGCASNVAIVEGLLAGRADLTLLSAPTGNECLYLASTRLPDIIVMEVMLRDIHGVEVVKMLRKVAPTSSIPVVALSSNALPEHIEVAMNSGFFRYLTKPFRFNELIQAIDDALDHAEQLRKENGAFVDL